MSLTLWTISHVILFIASYNNTWLSHVLGCEKTTFLDLLTGRRKTGNISVVNYLIIH